MNKKNLIGVLHIFSGDLWAGAEVMIFNLLSELNRIEGIKLYAICLNKGILAHKLLQEGIDVTIIEETKYSFFSIVMKCIKLCLNWEIDIIHSHRYKENLLAFLIKTAIKRRARLMSTIHGISERERGIKSIKDHLNFWILKNFFHVISVSEEIKLQLRKIGFSNCQIFTIHNGIRLPNIKKEKTKSDIIHVGTVGRFVKVKRYSLVLDIAYKLKKIRDNVVVSIMGNGPLYELLREKRKSLGLEKEVRFVSPVHDPFPYYNSLDIYINTSSHEGIPMSLLEAMSCRLPVVAFRVGGIPEIIEDSKEGFLVEQDDISGYIKKLVLLIDHPELRKIMGENSRKKIESSFSATLMARRYYNLYMKLAR